MEKPYRYKKKLIKTGNSTYVIVPANSLKSWANTLKIKQVTNVIMEVYKNKIVITPVKHVIFTPSI